MTGRIDQETAVATKLRAVAHGLLDELLVHDIAARRAQVAEDDYAWGMADDAADVILCVMLAVRQAIAREIAAGDGRAYLDGWINRRTGSCDAKAAARLTAILEAL